MRFLKIAGYGILCTVVLALLIVMCAILKESVPRDSAQDHAEGTVIRASTVLAVSKVPTVQ
jgi:hypothetical protein